MVFGPAVSHSGFPLRAGRPGSVDDTMAAGRLRLLRCRRADVDVVLAYRARPDIALHLRLGVWTREKVETELAAY